MAFIYKTTNIINNKIYIGKSKVNNPNYLGSGLRITGAIKKYGKDNFTKSILEECTDDIVNEREIYWIQHFNSTNDLFGYNISKGGNGGNHYWATLTEEQRVIHNRKISDGKRGKSHKPHSAETKKKMSDSFNRNPDFIKQRALAKCKTYSCINHSTKEIFITSNLNEFCLTHNLNKSTMQYNARTKKTLCNNNWSCREGKLHGTTIEIIEQIERDILVADNLIKTKIGARDKRGINNPMFGKKHSSETKEKIRQARKNKINDNL